MPRSKPAPRQEWFVWSRLDVDSRGVPVGGAGVELDDRRNFRLYCSAPSMKAEVRLEGTLDSEGPVSFFRSPSCSIRFEYQMGMDVRELGPCRLSGKRCTFNGLYGPNEQLPEAE